MLTNPIRVGVIFGLFLAFFHACWAGLVASGYGQKLLDFIFWAHFLSPVFRVQAFELTRAVILVGVTFAIGLTMGIIGGLCWNMFIRPADPQ